MLWLPSGIISFQTAVDRFQGICLTELGVVRVASGLVASIFRQVSGCVLLSWSLRFAHVLTIIVFKP